MYRNEKEKQSGLFCPQLLEADGKKSFCNEQYPEKFVKNRVTLYLRQLLEYYYAGKFEFITNISQVSIFVTSRVASK